jgi:hypothetical protein
MKKPLLFSAFVISVFSNAHSLEFTGTVNTLAPSRLWNGTIVKLDGMPGSIMSCNMDDAMLLQAGSGIDNVLYSTLLTAKTMGVAVKITTTAGCLTVNRPASDANNWTADTKTAPVIMQIQILD